VSQGEYVIVSVFAIYVRVTVFATDTLGDFVFTAAMVLVGIGFVVFDTLDEPDDETPAD